MRIKNRITMNARVVEQSVPDLIRTRGYRRLFEC